MALLHKLKVFTNEICPISGVWQSVNEDKKQVPIEKGQLMPNCNGIFCQWQIIFVEQTK